MPRQGHAKATRLRGYVLAKDSSNRLLSFQFLYFLSRIELYIADISNITYLLEMFVRAREMYDTCSRFGNPSWFCMAGLVSHGWHFTSLSHQRGNLCSISKRHQGMN